MVRPPYPVALRLCLIGAERFSELTATYYMTPNLLRLKPWKFIALVYAWCIERVDPDELDEWKADLGDLLPWQDSTSAAAVNAESESFMKMMQRG